MKFPVDLLADVSKAQLENLAHEYMDTLLYSKHDSSECLTLPDATQVTINISSMGFVPFYGRDEKTKILVLFSPSDLNNAIALYLLDRWWTVEDILKTADPARHGVLPVDTVGERIVLNILNRVIYRGKEISAEELPFLCHGENDHAKILWEDGEAVGFYSVKPTGSMYKRFSSQTYQLPVMDSIFVRKGHRGKGSGLLMLKDFVLNFSEVSLGLKYPLSNSMYRVCEKYLREYPEHADLLWEVESTGGPYQRTNIASKIQVMGLSAVSKSLSFSEESLAIAHVREDSITKQMKEATERSVEIMEETTVVRTTKATELAVTDRCLSGSRQSKLEKNITEELSEKVIRIEHIEAGASREDQASVQKETEMQDLQTEGMFQTVEDTSNRTPIAEEALTVKESHINLGSQESLEVSPANAEPRDKITQEEHIITHNSSAEVENVTSKNEEIKEDSAALVVYEEVFEVHTEVETLKQGAEGQVLRQKTIFSTKTVESNYIQQKSDKETNVNTLQTIDIVGELAVTDPDPEESQVLSDDILVMEKQLKDEELQNEELTGNKHEFGVKDAIPQEISSEHPDTAETLEEVQISDHMSDDETEEPPVALRRGRRIVNAKSTKHRQHKEEGEHTHEAELVAGRYLGRKEADEKAVDKQMEDQNEEETDQSMNKTPETSAQELLVEDGRTPGAQESGEDAITSTKVRIEINKNFMTKMPPEMDSEKQELTYDGNEETSGDNLEQPTASVPDEPQLTKDCEMPRLQQARVILVDLKTGSDYVSLMVAGETTEVQCLASEREEVELTADEKMDEDPETVLQPPTEEENVDLEECNGNEGKEDSSNDNCEEEEPFIETIYLRSGRKILKVGHQEHQHDDIAAVSTGDEDHEKETITNDSVTGEDPAEEKQSAEEASTQPEINEEIRLEEDEAPINRQPSIQVSMVKISAEVEVEENKTDDGKIVGIETGDKSVDLGEEKPKAEVGVIDDPSKEVSKINISAEVEAQTEEETPVTADVDEGPVTLSEDQENTADLTSLDTVQASNLEVPFIASKEKPHSEEIDLQESDLHRVTVVVVELRNSSQLLDEKTVTDSCVAEEQPAVEMEEQREDGQTETAPDVPVKASSVSEEAIATQNKQSTEDDEAEGVSGAEDTPVLERRVLRSGRKTGNIQTQRKGRRSAAATPKGKSKRAQTKNESEEQERDETIPTLEELTAEPKTEDVPQKEPGKEQDVQEENDGVSVAQEEEEMHLHCEEADETSQDEPASIGTALRKAKRTAPATSTHKSKRFCMQHESEEETSAADREVEDNKTDNGEIAEIENGDKSVDLGEEKPKSKVKVMDDPSEEAMAVAGLETCPNEQVEPSKEVSKINISAEVEAQTEEETPVTADVDEGPVTLSEDQENTADLTSLDTVQAPNLEEPFIASKEKPHSEEMDLQDSDLHRVTVVVVELRNSSQLLDEKTVTDSCVAEEQPAVEMEEQSMKEALREDGQTETAPDVPVKASSVSEEAIATQNKQSTEDDEAEGVSGAEDTPVLERRVLRSGRKTGNIQTQRKGRRSAAATPKGKSKRAQTKNESEEQERDEIIPTLEELTEEPKTDLEDVPQKEPSKEKDVHETNKNDDGKIAEIENGDKSVDQGEEKLKDMDVVSAEATTGTNSETHSNGEGENYLSESASAPVPVVEGDTDENKEPVVATHVCGSNRNTINSSAGTIPLKFQIEENEEETRETPSGPDEPEQRLLIHAEEQVIEIPEGVEEELAEETTSMEKETKIDGAKDQIIDSESTCLRAAESENFNNEPPEEVLETGTEYYGTRRGMEAEITETDMEPPTAAPEEDHLILFDEEAPTVTSRSQKSRTKRPKTIPKRTSRRQKKQGFVGIQQHVAESRDDKMQEEPEDPGETSQLSPTEEETDLSNRKEEAPLVKDITAYQAEDEAGLSEMVGDSGFITAKDLEESDIEESVEGDIVSVESEKDIGSNSELNSDENGKEFNLEVEENLSDDDDGELIVMGKKVLRGRTVPALIITPQSKSRRHHIEEFLSEEEKTPQSAQKKNPLKRKGTEATPGRRSKRRSRV